MKPAEVARYRNLIRVLEIKNEHALIVIPGMGYNRTFNIDLSEIPFSIHVGQYLHARLNLDAETSEELQPSDWEEK